MFRLLRMLALLLAGLFSYPIYAQQHLPRARQHSYLTKVFRLTDDQAGYLYRRGLRAARPEFFTQPVDSFPTDSVRRRWSPLPAGYYLVAHTEGPQLVYWLRSVTDRQVLTVNNQVDLTLLVRDSLGNLLPDAHVQLGGRAVPYDAATRSFRLARAGKPGLVAVTHSGRTTYHALELAPDYHSYSPSVGQRLKRIGNRVAFGFPLGYLTEPVRRLVRELRYPASVSTGLIGLLRSVFSEEVREQRQEQRVARRQNRWVSYVAFSQPRYRPHGDTLRLKARIVHRVTGRPAVGPLALWLRASGRERRLLVVQPVRPGSYQAVVPLADSLGLRADTRAEIWLADERRGTLAQAQFRVEDYELAATRYQLRLAETTHRRGVGQAIFVRGTDANELNLLDARVRLSLTPQGAPGVFIGRQLFVPDTLWTHAQPLDAHGETRLNVPATVFPAADLAYSVQATFLNSNNERQTRTASAHYTTDPGQLRLQLRADSVVADFQWQDQERPHSAWLEVSGNEALSNGTLLRQRVRLPYRLPLDPRATEYELTDSAGRRAVLTPDDTNAALALRSDRTPDSLYLALDNPRHLPVWYFLYQGSRLCYRGYGTEWQMAIRTTDAGPWFASVHYLWGDELRALEYSMPLMQKQLRIHAEQPEVAYPGQQLQLRYTVTDAAGRPVPRADLTAYAYTSKFEAPAAPALPSFEPRLVGRVARRRFAIGESFENSPGEAGKQPLRWADWRGRLGLDSLRFYQFLYPETGTFYEYQPAPGGITQLAPFVVDSGRVQPVVAVYVDDVPVYVHDVNQREPYALVADSGRHTVAVRTATHLVTLPDVYLRPLHKLTLSIDQNTICEELLVEKRGLLSEEEQRTLQRYLLLVDAYVPTTLRQGQRLQRVGHTNLGNMAIAGPFRPDSVLLRRTDGLRRKFLLEPFYRYHFEPGLLKMTSITPDALGSLRGSGFAGALPLGDFALTESALQASPEITRWRQRWPSFAEVMLDYVAHTPVGQGRLEIRLPAPKPYPAPRLPEVAYVLVTQPGKASFSRLLRGGSSIHALTAGRYRVAVLLADSTCLAPPADIVIRPNGTTYLQLQTEDRQPYGPASRRVLAAVRAHQIAWLKAHRAATEPAPRREIRVAVPVQSQHGWQLVRGRVLDRETEEGLPGVTVLVKGTKVGTSTLADGSFTLSVPPVGATLVFSSIGYQTQEQRLAAGQQDITVALQVDTKALNEVVVVGYGVQRRQELTGAVTTVSALQGRVAGVNIEGTGSVRIRGASTVAGDAAPLLIVNGVPYAGRVEDLSPGDIASLQVLKGDQAALYGSRAAKSGVIIIETKPNAQLPKSLRAAAAATLAATNTPGQDPEAALRRHFRDYAWWRPTLVTDARGQATTTITLPDDVTGWDTFVLGSDDHGRTGSITSKLRSFKALLAELAVPRFLVEGDRVQVLGKVLNYLPDTAQVTTSFQVGSEPARTHQHRVATAVLDTLTVTAPPAGDSLRLTFRLTRANGYQDGEQRTVAVVPAGTRERVGTFAVLTAPDTTLTFRLNPALGTATVRLESDPLPVVLREIEHLQQYAYLCNEQMASRLKGLLLQQRILTWQGQPFRAERNVNYLIRRLLEGRHQPEGLWGTWPKSEVSAWATLHVVEALLAAQQQNYTVKLDRAALRQYLLRALDEEFAAADARRAAGAAAYTGGYFRTLPDRLRLLQLLHQLDASVDYRTYLDRLAREPHTGRQPLDQYLLLTELRQQLHLPYQLDSLRRYRLATQLGGVWYADTLRTSTYYRYVLNDRIGTTLLAYRVLRAEGGHAAELQRIRTYLLQQRGASGYFGSTYETAQVLETIGPELLPTGAAPLAAQVQLQGALNQEVRQFPFEVQVPAGAEPLVLRKQGLLPVYATAYQSFWNAKPTATAAPFTVTTTLAGQAGSRIALRAGQPAELVVTVDVRAEARYVLVEVPIPAGCSYAPDKAPGNSFEVHREYLRHQTGIFIDRLPVGKHTFRIALQPRYRGQYTLNPARAELVYFPTRFGRSASKQAVVE
ncbi:carboxypeptidase-like regulatory domain-containing protein [Hymenobacter aerilatus]|uniref:Carboxypeptidase-like regulatory domain-containing protein n=1 Tax=Hymenobacter aerilatus TaxID=2932251 RepID=A0A8T9SZ28_9BACT|nr:carboxypeptidase-like regulatory domain-containing protein [Hymenobacter aerilatus]UOR06651.1 carboxypeptidase-like regulatory domain-containing protein [Hymenobacter aerilatus]